MTSRVFRSSGRNRFVYQAPENSLWCVPPRSLRRIVLNIQNHRSGSRSRRLVPKAPETPLRSASSQCPRRVALDTRTLDPVAEAIWSTQGEFSGRIALFQTPTSDPASSGGKDPPNFTRTRQVPTWRIKPYQRPCARATEHRNVITADAEQTKTITEEDGDLVSNFYHPHTPHVTDRSIRSPKVKTRVWTARIVYNYEETRRRFVDS